LPKSYIDKSAFDGQKLLYGAISGMVRSLGDPYTAFLSPDQNEAVKDELAGSYEGVGIQIGFNEDNRLVVITPLKGTPAEKAGLLARDQILKIDDKDAGIGGGGFSFTGVYGLDIQKQLSISSTGWVVDFEQGSVINPGESGAVLIGKKIADDYHKFVGSSLEIDGKKYRVKGIFEAESELIENVIVMNLEDARDLAGIPSDEVNTFTVGLVDPSRDDEIAKLMEFKYGDDLQVFSMSQSSDLLGGILGQFRLVVFFVAAISAVVASVGIMNTILMSIFDRIKEIGALKAVGWTNSNIVKMVMYESLALGVVGGIVGLMVGFGIDVFLNSQFGLPYSITPMLLLEAFSFAVLLGLIAGIYPAFRAAKLDPVEAMRY